MPNSGRTADWHSVHGSVRVRTPSRARSGERDWRFGPAAAAARPAREIDKSQKLDSCFVLKNGFHVGFTIVSHNSLC